MKRALLFLLLPSLGWGAIGYSRFAHPKGYFALEYPSNWKRSYGLEALIVRPPGKGGEEARVSVEGYPIDKKSPPTPKAFVESLLASAKSLKKVEADVAATVDGKPARRLALIETVAYKGKHGQALPGPLREVYVVVPAGDHYYVVKLAGVGEAYAKALPEFERIVGSLKVKR